MASRQEEKERRRRERLEREAAAAAAAKRKRTLQIAGGGLLVAIVAAGVAFGIVSGGGDGDGDESSPSEVRAAAQAAGCQLRQFPSEGRDHVSEELDEDDYKTNPPTSGPHSPEPAQDGIYAPGNEPEIASWIHSLEHGRVLLQYRPGVDEQVVKRLEGLFAEDVGGSGGGYHSLLLRNNSKMPFQVAAVAWQRYIGCDRLTPQAVEAVRRFREAFVDKAPEFVP